MAKESEKLLIARDEMPSYEQLSNLIEFMEITILNPIDKAIEEGTFESSVTEGVIRDCDDLKKMALFGKVPVDFAKKHCEKCISKAVEKAYRDYRDTEDTVNKLRLLKSNI